MNTVTTAANIPETAFFSPRSRAAGETETADFRDMLKDALKTNKQRPTKEAEGEKKSGRPQRSSKSQKELKSNAEDGAGVEAGAVAVAQTSPDSRIPAEQAGTPGQDQFEIVWQAGAAGIEAPKVQPELEGAEAVQSAAQQGVLDVEGMTPDIQDGDILYDAAISAAARQAHVETQPVSRQEEAQTRFERMLTEASEQLEQVKAAEDTEIQIIEELAEEPLEEELIDLELSPPEIEMAEPEEDGAETIPVPELNDEDTQDEASAPKAIVEDIRTAPKTEQKPLKEMPKTDETIMDLTHTKKPEIAVERISESRVERAPEPVHIPEQAEQVRIQVIEHLEKEKMEFTMRLNPEELGKLDVKMVLEGGKLAVEVIAANAQSAGLLSKQAESLVSSLKASYTGSISVEVVTANENASGNMDSRYNLNDFRNQQGTHEQNDARSSRGRDEGRRGGATGENSGGQTTGSEAMEPQRILNYSI